MKTFIRGILTTILVFTFTLIPTVLFAKEAVTKDLVGTYAKEEISTEIVNNIKKELPEVEEAKITALEEKLQSDEKTQEIIDKYIARVLNDLDSEKVSDINIEEDVKSIIKENRQEFETVVGRELSDEKIDEVINEISEKEDINGTYKEMIEKAKQEMPRESKTLITSYNSISSQEFIVVLVVITVISIIALAFLKKPYYKWIANVGIAGIIASIMIAIIGSSMTLVLNFVLGSMNQTTLISVAPMLLTATILLAVSIIFLVINSIVDKNRNKKHVIS